MKGLYSEAIGLSTQLGRLNFRTPRNKIDSIDSRDMPP